MPKYKNISKKEMKAESDIYTIRPATKQDKWCRFHSELARKINDEAPYGYVVVIPNYRSKAHTGLDFYGKVIRTKVHNGSLYLQVSSTRRDIEDYMKNIYIISIRSLVINKKVKTSKGKRKKRVTKNVLNIYRSNFRFS